MEFIKQINVNDVKETMDLDSNFSHILRAKSVTFSDDSVGTVVLKFGEIEIADFTNPTQDEIAKMIELIRPVYEYLFKLYKAGGLFIESVPSNNRTALETAGFRIEDGELFLLCDGYDLFYTEGVLYFGADNK